MRITLSLLLFLSVSLSACQPKEIRKPVTKIEVTTSNSMVKQGEVLTISFSVNTFKSDLQKIIVFIDEMTIHESTDKSFKININTTNYNIGNHMVKVVAINDDFKEGVNYGSFFIASDIVPENMTYQIIDKIPHNPKYFTQGLEFNDNILFEGTGEHGTSALYAYHPKTGKILQSVELDKAYFGEGITIMNNKIYQLTYKTQIGFIYDLKTFKKISEFTFQSEEGWGLTNDGNNLIMSDGTSFIHYIDTLNFQVVKSIEVCNHQGKLTRLNELEYVDEMIYANIWTTDLIVKIDAHTGKVLEQIDMKGILDDSYKNKVDVLNGIAYHSSENIFYVTGKYWPFLYKVKFVPKK